MSDHHYTKMLLAVNLFVMWLDFHFVCVCVCVCMCVVVVVGEGGGERELLGGVVVVVCGVVVDE